MISSESINYSKYSIINQKNISTSTDREEGQQNKTGEKEKNNESISNLIPNEKENDYDKMISLAENEGDSSNKDLLYGNNIEKINPKFLGKSLALFYNSEGNPRITIGPDCKLIIFKF